MFYIAGNNMSEYWNENWPIMLDDVQQHATMVLSSLAIAFSDCGCNNLIILTA
jgi:hypothetical protein